MTEARPEVSRLLLPGALALNTLLMFLTGALALVQLGVPAIDPDPRPTASLIFLWTLAQPVLHFAALIMLTRTGSLWAAFIALFSFILLCGLLFA